MRKKVKKAVSGLLAGAVCLVRCVLRPCRLRGGE